MMCELFTSSLARVPIHAYFNFLFNQVPYTWLQPLLGPSLLEAGLVFPAVLSSSLYKAQQLHRSEPQVRKIFLFSVVTLIE